MSGAWRRKILEWKGRKEEIRCCLNYFNCKKRGLHHYSVIPIIFAMALLIPLLRNLYLLTRINHVWIADIIIFSQRPISGFVF